MILCLDVGNSQLFGGVFSEDKIQLKFRYDSKQAATSDQLGVFLKAVLEANNIKPDTIKQIAICSVVPNLDYSLRAACMKYFEIEPFMLQAGVKTGLKINYRNPLEVGADRISNSIAATHLYPNKNIIVADFGTATTLCVITKNREYLGGAIMAGIKLAMTALQNNTAKLPSVEILRPDTLVGRSTMESIQIGLYYSQVATIREMVSRFNAEMFTEDKAFVIGTGGFSGLFSQENLFDTIHQDLVLEGLRLALELNSK